MCFENVNNRKDLIREIEDLEEVEANLLIEACKKNKNISDFSTQVAVIKSNLSNLKEQLEKEIKERKNEIKEVVSNYTIRLNQLDTDLSHLSSKFNGFTGEVYKEFTATREDIFKLSKEINGLKIELQTKFTKGINKLLIAIISSGVLIVVSYFLGKYLEAIFK